MVFETIPHLREENARLREALRATGVCMSCVASTNGGQPCTDCLNTGWNDGCDPWESAQLMKAEVHRLRLVLTQLITDTFGPEREPGEAIPESCEFMNWDTATWLDKETLYRAALLPVPR